ncbi:PD-(D/E)XK nuclease family protein [bacterium]|nr:PD-(D/E)XK nuclease family protein [bacterium]
MTVDLPYLSASRIKTYLMCPQKYRLTYIDKVPWAFTPAALVVGTAVHAAIEQFYRAWMDGHRLPLADLHDVYNESWKEGIAGKTLDTDDPAPLRDQGRDLITVLHEQVHPQNVVAVEQDFRVPLIASDTGEVLDIDLVGRIDLVEADDQGNIVIADNKTLARRPSEQDLALDLQLTAYAYAARHMDLIPNDTTALLRIDALLKQKTPSLAQIYTTRSPDADIRFVHLAADIIHAIQSGAFPANPGWACSGCPLRPACSFWS